MARAHEDHLPQPMPNAEASTSRLEKQRSKGNKIGATSLFRGGGRNSTDHQEIEAAVRQSSKALAAAQLSDEFALTDKGKGRRRERKRGSTQNTIGSSGADGAEDQDEDIITRLFAGAAEKQKHLTRESRSSSGSDESTCVGSTTDEDGLTWYGTYGAAAMGADASANYGQMPVNIDQLTQAFEAIWNLRLEKAFEVVSACPRGNDPNVLAKWHLHIARSQEPEAEAFRILRMSMELCSQGFFPATTDCQPSETQLEAAAPSSNSSTAAGTESVPSEADTPVSGSAWAQADFAAAYAAASPEVRRQMLGDRLHAEIEQIEPELAGKITGMMLCKDSEALLELLAMPEQLRTRVGEAARILRKSSVVEAAGEENVVP